LSGSYAYIGVLIDDLVPEGSSEPYRMMTSRAEYRLLLRQDNAHLRLTELGRNAGLVDDDRWAAFTELRDGINEEYNRLGKVTIAPSEAVQATLARTGSAELKTGVGALQMLRRPEVRYVDLIDMGIGRNDLPRAVVQEVETLVKYEGYIQKELDQVERVKRLEAKRLPDDLDYFGLKGLSTEAREKLTRIRPETLGQASRISGVSPADVAMLMVYLEQRRPCR